MPYAYTLVLASLLMLSSSTADRLGRRRVFQVGLALFSLGSLLCALAPSLELLVAFRIVQAIVGAMLSPVAMSIVRNVFEEPRERAHAISVFAAMFGISMALGPVLGGCRVSAISWRAVFLVNVPVGLAATALFVPDSRASRPRRIDLVGQVLVIAALTALTYAIVEAGRVGFGVIQIVGDDGATSNSPKPQKHVPRWPHLLRRSGCLFRHRSQKGTIRLSPIP